jgi:hypothetical protein
MGRARKFLSKEICLAAMSKTRSNRAAARYLHVSFGHYKKYAKLYKDEETGKTLWEAHKNEAGKGIPKFLLSRGDEPPLLDILEGRVPIYHFTPKRIKERILQEALIEECCSRCKFEERRVLDFRVPLILQHKNGDKEDFRLQNLEFMCYNCSFLYATSPITDEQVIKMEDYLDKNGKDFDWEIDETYKQHLKELGLWSQEKLPTSGSQYISYQ